MSLINGSTTDRFSDLRERFETSLESGEDLGASLAVYHHGELVCDLWGGFSDETRTRPWERDTLVNVWSTTKTMVFLVVLMLYERGELDVDAPAARYWPEFGVEGKSDITIRHLMNHTAGLPGFSPAIKEQDLADWERCVEDLARQAPWWSDRGVSGYHAVTQGYLLGEIVRRVTGTTVGRFFDAEVASVLGADFYIGLPEALESRVSYVVAPDSVEWTPHDTTTLRGRAMSAPVVDPRAPRERWWRAAEIPAANGHGNARSVALVQQIIANSGHAEGHRFLSEATVERIFQPSVTGVDGVLDFDVTFGLGYGLTSSAIPIGPRACYWGGFGGSIVFIDQSLELTVAYAMNKMNFGLVGDTRGATFALAAVLATLA